MSAHRVGRYVQEMPPPGGFGRIRFKPYLPVRGPPGWMLFLGYGAMTIWGLNRIAYGNREQAELKREKLACRSFLVPLLQAEEDARYLAEKKGALKEEAKLMKDVDGWKVGKSVYSHIPKGWRWAP